MKYFTKLSEKRITQRDLLKMIRDPNTTKEEYVNALLISEMQNIGIKDQRLNDGQGTFVEGLFWNTLGVGHRLKRKHDDGRRYKEIEKWFEETRSKMGLSID